MDEEFLKRIEDYFTGPELVELLSVPVEDLVALLLDQIEDNQIEIEEFMEYGR